MGETQQVQHQPPIAEEIFLMIDNTDDNTSDLDNLSSACQSTPEELNSLHSPPAPRKDPLCSALVDSIPYQIKDRPEQSNHKKPSGVAKHLTANWSKKIHKRLWADEIHLAGNCTNTVQTLTPTEREIMMWGIRKSIKLNCKLHKSKEQESDSYVHGITTQ